MNSTVFDLKGVSRSATYRVRIQGKKFLLLDFVLATVSFCLPFIVHWRLLTTNLVDRLHIYQDVTLSIFPALVHISSVAQIGDLPLWNWHVYSGMYEGGTFYNHFLYPLSYPFSLGWLDPSSVAVFHGYLLCHLGIGALGMYCLSRSLKFNSYLSLLGACVYVFSYLASYSLMAGGAFLLPFAWLPFALMAWRSFALGGSPRLSLWGGLAWFFCLLSANPIVIVPVIPLVVVWLVIWAREGKKLQRCSRYFVSWMTLSFVLSGGLWLGQAIPLWESMSVSSRNAQHVYEWAQLSWRGSKEFWDLLRAILLPHYGGSPLSVASLGAVGTVLFGAGVWLARRGWERSLVWFTLIMAAVLFLPGALMLYDFAYVVMPLVGRINAIDRGALAYLLPAILIALVGVRNLLKNYSSLGMLSSAYPAFSALVIYTLVYGLGALYFDYNGMKPEDFLSLIMHMALFVFSAFVLLRLMANRSVSSSSAMRYLITVLIIAFLDGSAFTRDQLNDVYMNAETMRTSGVHSYFGHGHELNIGQPSIARPRVNEPRNQQAMLRSEDNVAGYYQFQPLWVTQAIISSDIQDDYLRRNSNSFDTNLKWPRLTVERLYDLATDNRLGRAFPAAEGLLVQNGRQALEVVAAKEFDPSRRIVYEDWDASVSDYPNILQRIYKLAPSYSVPKLKLLQEPISLNNSTWLLSQSTNSVSFKVRTAGRFLFFSNSWHPGWIAFVNGKEVPVLRANHAFMAVSLPGTLTDSTVDFIFRPIPYFVGLAFTIFSAIAWIMVFSLCAGHRCSGRSQ